MKTALIMSSVPTENVGGIEAHQSVLIETLNQLGYKVTVAAPVSAKTSPFYFFRLFRVLGLGTVFSNLRSIFFCRYSVVLVNDPHVGLLSLSALFTRAPRRMIFSHGWIFHTNKFESLKKFLFKKISIRLLAQFSSVLCVSQSDLAQVSELKNAILVKNPVRFLKNPKRHRDPCLVKKNAFCILSRHSENKNVERALRVFSLIEKELLDATLTVMGRGVSVLTRFELPNSVKILESPSRSEINSQFERAQYFICLSKYEGFGISVVEAVSQGLVPIMSNNPAYTEHAKHFLLSKLVELEKTDSEIANDVVEFIKDHISSNDIDHLIEANTAYAQSFSASNFSNNIRRVLHTEKGTRGDTC
jgi:glycosyltransferase involved in cell wall biosynthesis